jgi:hypothetical protein
VRAAGRLPSAHQDSPTCPRERPGTTQVLRRPIGPSCANDDAADSSSCSIVRLVVSSGVMTYLRSLPKAWDYRQVGLRLMSQVHGDFRASRQKPRARKTASLPSHTSIRRSRPVPGPRSAPRRLPALQSWGPCVRFGATARCASDILSGSFCASTLTSYLRGHGSIRSRRRLSFHQ